MLKTNLWCQINTIFPLGRVGAFWRKNSVGLGHLRKNPLGWAPTPQPNAPTPQRKFTTLSKANKRIWSNRPVFGTPVNKKPWNTNWKCILHWIFLFRCPFEKNLYFFYVVQKTSLFGQTVPYLAPPVNQKTLTHQLKMCFTLNILILLSVWKTIVRF